MSKQEYWAWASKELDITLDGMRKVNQAMGRTVIISGIGISIGTALYIASLWYHLLLALALGIDTLTLFYMVVQSRTNVRYARLSSRADTIFEIFDLIDKTKATDGID